MFDDPRRARSFFEALVADNIDIGRPKRVNAVFGIGTRGRPRTKQPHQTRMFTPGTEVHIDFRFKHSRVKQYLKDARSRRGPISASGRAESLLT